MRNKIIAKAKKIKNENQSPLVEKPKLVDSKGLIKKAKRVKKNKTNIVTPMIDNNAGCTPAGFGVTCSENIDKAKAIISARKRKLSATLLEQNEQEEVYNVSDEQEEKTKEFESNIYVDLKMVKDNSKEAGKRINQKWLEYLDKEENKDKTITINSPKEAEIRLDSMINNSEVVGERKSYDLQDTRIAYKEQYRAEVKFYPDLESPIVLGKDGFPTRFPEISFILNALNYMQSFIITMKNRNNLVIFKSMLNNAYNKYLQKFKGKKIDGKSEYDKAKKILEYIEKDFDEKNKTSIVYKIINSKVEKEDNWKQLDDIYYIFKSITDEIFNNNCEYVKLLNKGTIYVAKQSDDGNLIINVSNDEIDIRCEKMSEKENIKAEQTVRELIEKLKHVLQPLEKYEEDGHVFTKIQENLSIKLSKPFTEEHPLIMVNKSNNHKPLVLGIFKKVRFIGIGKQGGNCLIVPDLNDPEAYIA